MSNFLHRKISPTYRVALTQPWAFWQMKSWTSSKLALCCSIRSERTERNTHVLIAKFNAIWLFNRSLLEYFFSNPIFFLNISTNTLVKFQKKLNSYFVRKNPSRQIVTKVKTVFMEFRICKKKNGKYSTNWVSRRNFHVSKITWSQSFQWRTIVFKFTSFNLTFKKWSL